MATTFRLTERAFDGETWTATGADLLRDNDGDVGFRPTVRS